MCAKKSFFLLFLFLLFSLSAFSQDGNTPALGEEFSVSSGPSLQEDPAEMTDAEIIAELMDNLKKRETSIIEKEQSISTREARLTARESDWTEREKNLEERNNLLTLREQVLVETENYWKNYKKDTLKDKILIGVISFAGGYVARVAQK